MTDLNNLGDGSVNFNPSPNNSITLTLPLAGFSNNVTFEGSPLILWGQAGEPAQFQFQNSFNQSNQLQLGSLASAGTGYNASVTAGSWTVNTYEYFNIYGGSGGTLTTSGTNQIGFSGGDAAVTIGSLNLGSNVNPILEGGTGGALAGTSWNGDQGGTGGNAILAGGSVTLSGNNNFTLWGGTGGAANDTGSVNPTGGLGGNASVSLNSLQASLGSYLYLYGGQGGNGAMEGPGGTALANVGTLALNQSGIYLTGYSDISNNLGGGTGGSTSLSFGTLSETQGSITKLVSGTGGSGTSSAANGGDAVVQGSSATITGSQFYVTGGNGGSLGSGTGNPGGNGGNAGVSLVSLTSGLGSFLSLTGGTGGTGGSALTGSAGNGGMGGSVSLILNSLSMGTSVQLYLRAGSGGTGGNGSSGGNGGTGGNASVTLSSLALGTGSLLSALAGSGGAGGSSGVTGAGGTCDMSVTMLTGSGSINLSGPNGGILQLNNGLFAGTLNVGSLIVQNSGSMTLNGSSNLTMGTTVMGALTLGSSAGLGNLQGPLTIASGGNLTGYGLVNGTVTNSGTVTPLGTARQTTLTFSQFNQLAGGILDVNLPPTSLNVGNTTLSISSGALLGGTLIGNVLPLNYGFRDIYPILSGAPVTGTFSTVDVSVPGMGSSMVYGSNSVTLFLIQNHAPFASYAQNVNETTVGSVLDASLLTCSDSLADKMGELNAMSTGQAGVLNQMGGVIYTALPGALLNQTQYEDGLIFNHMGTGAASGPNLARLVLPGDPLSGNSLAPAATRKKKSAQATVNPGDSSPEGLWLETADSFGSSGPTSQVSAFNISNYGLVGGYDWILEKGFSLGLLGGYLQSTVQPADGSANANITGAQFGLYGRAAFGDFSLAFLGGYVADHLNSARSVVLGADTNSLTGSFNGDQIQAALQMDVRLSDVGSTFRPFWGFLYAHLSENAFSETGSDSLALSLPALAYDSFRAYAGLEETFNFALGKNSMLSPRLHATASKDLVSLDPAFETSLAGAPGNPFQITGIVPDGTDFGLGGGLNLSLGPELNFFADFDGHFTSTGNLSTITGGMSLDI